MQITSPQSPRSPHPPHPPLSPHAPPSSQLQHFSRFASQVFIAWMALFAAHMVADFAIPPAGSPATLTTLLADLPAALFAGLLAASARGSDHSLALAMAGIPLAIHLSFIVDLPSGLQPAPSLSALRECFAFAAAFVFWQAIFLSSRPVASSGRGPSTSWVDHAWRGLVGGHLYVACVLGGELVLRVMGADAAQNGTTVSAGLIVRAAVFAAVGLALAAQLAPRPRMAARLAALTFTAMVLVPIAAYFPLRGGPRVAGYLLAHSLFVTCLTAMLAGAAKGRVPGTAHRR